MESTREESKVVAPVMLLPSSANSVIRAPSELIVTPSMCIRVRTCFITSTGHGAPPIIPVRRLERS